MCGIIGRLNYKYPIDRDVFTVMRDTLTHRGPDGCGLYISDNQKTALGHRRLSFLDLSEAGTQPISNETQKIWLTINGEIYNYKELRKILQDKGHLFKSETDSEVVIHGYEEWGIEVLNRLNGMFAFGLWDDSKKLLFMARDRFGIKPLYYYKSDDTFIFASEIKAIVKDPAVPRNINYKSFTDFFTYRYIPSPASIWENISKLPPAHYLIVKDETVNEPTCYWQLTTENKDEAAAAVIEKTNYLLHESVKKHIQSDVPVGSFLSGGYDSSALVYYLHSLKYQAETFSIGFENWEHSEHQYAQIVADTFKMKNNAIIIGKESLNLLQHLSYVYDEPLADISIIPTYVVSKEAAKSVKTVLSGEGADEIFCGYTWHKHIYEKNLNQSFYYKFIHNLSGNKLPFTVKEYSQAMAMGLFDKPQLKGLLKNDLHNFINPNPFWFYQSHYKKELSTIKQLQYMDIKTFMGELVLTKVDRSSMANALEVRVPFLEHNLVDYLFNLDEKTYYKPEYKKYVLYENIKNHLPQTILKRSKQGFVGPDSYYQDIEFYGAMLREGHLVKAHLINKDTVSDWLHQKDHWRLWKLLIMELWYTKWVIEKDCNE